MVKITSIDGVIASNTSIARDKLLSGNKKEMGGLSGKPITEKSTEVIRYLHSNIDTMQRIEILRSLRLGEFDVLIHIKNKYRTLVYLNYDDSRFNQINKRTSFKI